MTINLISQFGAERARTSLESSFAQFQADKAVVGLARQISRNEKAMAELAGSYECHLGDFGEYSDIRAAIKEIEKVLSFKSKKHRLQGEEEIAELRRQMRAHPCHSCSDREGHSRYAERIQRLKRENMGLHERVAARTNVIARRFDLVRAMLDELGYIQGNAITPSGKLLSKIYGETDLLIAETIQSGDLDTLNPQELVSVLSAFVYETRREEPPKVPRGEVQDVLAELVHRWGSIYDKELAIGLEPLREPDLGFCFPSFRWASGHSLTAILKGTELTVGDFVRNMKQIIDLLRQIGIAAPHLQPIVTEALRRVDRGVIAYAGAIA
jgi:ATP-dependent RNA helicase HelY